jgi:hypothetical protein
MRKDDILNITYGQGAFSNEDMDEIDDILSHFGVVRRNFYFKEAVGITVPGIIIITLGAIGGAIAIGFFRALGSDIYLQLKKKVIDTLSKKDSNRLLFILYSNSTEIRIVSLPSSVEEVGEVFDTISKAKDIIINALLKEGTPKMTEVIVKYEDGWKIDYGTYRRPNEFYFCTYDEPTGTWIRDESFFKMG